MFFILSKLLPLFVYPLGMGAWLMLLGLWLNRKAERRQWAQRVFILALLLVWLTSTEWFADLVTYPLEYRHIPTEEVATVDAIVVLGGMTHAQVSPRPIVGLNEAAERLTYAAQLYHDGKAPVVLVSGGNLPFSVNEESEADTMAEVLGQLGVPSEAIWLEEQSVNTYENGLYSSEILENAGISHILLVTSAKHMPRSVLIFQKQGLTVTPAPADFDYVQNEENLENNPNFLLATLFRFLPQAEDAHLTAEALKEYIGIGVYWLRGWL